MVATTFQPLAWKCFAVAAPMPEKALLIRMVFTAFLFLALSCSMYSMLKLAIKL